MNEILSGNIARYRKEQKLTQEELAGRLGVTFQAVSKWETAQSAPEIETLTALAMELKVSVDKLLGYTAFATDNTYYDTKYSNSEYYWGVQPSDMCLKVYEYLPPTRPLTLLDIGCGEGKDAVFFARCGYQVSAFDLSEAGLEKTRRLAEQAHVNVLAFKADIHDYRLTEKYDILYSTGIFDYIKPELRDEILENYKSHVNDGGLVAFQTFVNKPFIHRSPEKRKSHGWKSGQLATYFHDWYIEQCPEYVFNCSSGGVPHKHAANRLFARNIKELQ